MSTPYKLESLPQALVDLQVSVLRVVAHTLGPVTPGGKFSQNHWSLYLLCKYQGAPVSIRLNMTPLHPGTEDNTGVLALSYCPYQETGSAVRKFDFGAHGTVRQFIDCVKGKRRERYMHTEAQIGCRYWV